MVRFIVRSTPAVEPLIKGNASLSGLGDGSTFEAGGRTWLFRDHGRFATIATMTDTVPFVAVVIPPAFARMRAVEISRDLDRGVTPAEGVYRRLGSLPCAGGGQPVAA